MTGLQERVRSAPRTGSGRRRLALGAGIACVALLVWIIGFSSVLGASNVTVHGTHLLSVEQISAAAGIKPGTPLVRLDKAAVQRRVEQLPAVRSARVATAYPSTVTITVIERVGVGYRSTASGIAIVDADDVSFRRVGAPPHGLPLLAATSDNASERAVATVAGALPPAMATLVARVSAATPESVTLTLGDGRSVLWGGTDRNGEKARLLTVLLARPGAYFDISDPGSVISRGGN